MKHKKILLLNRRKTPNLYSIENVNTSLYSCFHRSTDILISSKDLPFPTKPHFFLLNCLYALYQSIYFDLVHQTGDSHYVLPFCLFSKRLLTIHDLRQLSTYKGIKHRVYKFLWFYLPTLFSSRIICISSFTHLALLKSFPHTADKSTIIHNPLRNEFFVNPPASQEKNIFNATRPLHFLIVGTRSNKNANLSLHLLSYIKTSFIVNVVGRKADLAKEHIINTRSSGFCRELNFYENISNKSLITLYDYSHFLLFLSSYEGFGLPILEAQSRGVIPIVNNIEPMSSLCSSDNALLFNSLSISYMAPRLITLLDQPELCAKLCANAYRNACHHHPEYAANSYLSLYLSSL